MSYSIQTIPKFDKQAKKLSKKHISFKHDFLAFVSSLRKDPLQGIYIGKNCYKIRLAITSKGKGKRGGVRIITHVVLVKETIILISIYDKSDQNNLTHKELEELLKDIPQ